MKKFPKDVLAVIVIMLVCYSVSALIALIASA